MKYTQLNKYWNADPNAPESVLTIKNNSVELEFFLNYFIFHNFNKGDKGLLIFNKCHKYSFNNMNNEGYYMGKYRYKNHDLPWGEFYELDSDWQNDFHNNSIILNSNIDKQYLKHFIFFMRDNTFECVAENYIFQVLTMQKVN